MLALQPMRFAQKVGVAPSTTTMTLGNDQGRRPAPLGPKARRIPMPKLDGARYLDPYTSEVDMRGGLGVVSRSQAWKTGRPYDWPSTTAFVYNSNPPRVDILGVVDPNDQWNTGQWNRLREHGTTVMRYWRQNGAYHEQLVGQLGLTNGEINRSLSGLGAVPNDDDLARIYGYTPVHYGWTHGTTPDGKKYYSDGLFGIGDDNTPTMTEMLKIQRRQMIFQGVSTAAIATLAGLALWGALRGGLKPARVRRKRGKRR